jgi:beta-glucosidase
MFTITNSGAVAGAEVAQVYVGHLPGDVPTAPKQLAGFVKVALDTGQHEEIAVDVPRSALSYWDTGLREWVTPIGEAAVYVGSSSQDVRLEGTIEIA